MVAGTARGLRGTGPRTLRRHGTAGARASVLRRARDRAARRRAGSARTPDPGRGAGGRRRPARDRRRPALSRRGLMEIDVFTLFPEAFGWFERQRHVANALAHDTRLEYVNYRDYTPLNAGQVDDTPFGGGAAMVLRVDVVEAALRARYGRDPVELRERRRVIALTPTGRLLDDALVDELAREPELTLLSGRYEGFDQRIVEHFASDELSIGRYVLAGGELPAMVVSDAVLRKLPGV